MPRSPRPSDDPYVRVRGARVHNLRDVDVDIPRGGLVAFTGISGSGKSSLAFATIYAEAQRRYFESIAPYVRRLLNQIPAPQVKEITGLPPAVALQQRRGAGGVRSTVGTLTTLSNLLRLLMSRAGTYPPGTTDRLDSDAFSPNTAVGACPTCHGLGRTHVVSERLMVPDPNLSIRDGAIAAWPGAWQGVNLRDILVALGYDVDRPWRRLPKRDRDWILYTEEQPVVEVHPQRDRGEGIYNGRFWSAASHVMHTLTNSKSPKMRERALRFVEVGPCPTCDGTGLKPQALAVTFAGHNISELSALPLAQLAEVLRPTATLADPEPAWESSLSGERSEVAVTLAADLCDRIAVLVDLGLGYLQLNRPTPTLSPGEAQRLRIATQLRSGLFGVVYVLDEPSASLHPADAEPLMRVLERLRAAGNSIFVVEHDMDVVRRADWIVDVGPGAGEGGGRIVYSGQIAGLRDVEGSATRPYLFPTRRRAPRRVPREPAGWLRLRGIDRHNLRDLDVDLPLGVLTAVTGVSGSGKSTLITQVVAGIVREHLGLPAPAEPDDEEPGGPGSAPAPDGPTTAADVHGLDAFDRLVSVDQKPIGRTPRSNLATYTGLFDAVRKVFANTDGARERGYDPGRFSFNVAAGRCPTCQGEGFVTVELIFLPGTYAPCPTCHGARYNAETLEITYQGATIADVLAMTVDTAARFLADVPAAARSLRTLLDVGLGYLRLGQPATELSGGEAQRIKLATELQRAHRGHTLYLLDEPTTGLHPADVELLTRQLQGLVDAGNSVMLVEHEMNLVAAADWVVDLGPGGGDAGGRIVAAGPPHEVATGDGDTARYLARALAGPSRRRADA
ncbi:excinuclease ABC subunit A [Rhizocola hellebori]|uniref:UvrABC system protein A n=1 Tax=Rhizocola hellebori TaxID=1392758 RepID=A0A8J3VDZ0_9ACTN|nr:excinuclease ABC subunit UvrA [Rhizocola hellebori]GIH02847.1 excinuclease ABC subunit A [Rhizocola hellebori]